MSDAINWQEIAAQLQAPFAAHEVKRKKGRGGQMLDYIDARAVAARLDATVGAGNWSFDWDPMVIQRPERGTMRDKDGNSVPAPEPQVDAVCVAKGTLTIYGVSKSDIGYAGAIEPNKASISNALRRCAALWGIGRYLYDQERAPTARPPAQNGAQRPTAAIRDPGRNPAPQPTRAPAASTAPAAGDSPSSAAIPQVASEPRATLDQLSTIKSLVAALGWGDDDKIEYLHPYHATKFGQLTEGEAAACIADLTPQAQRVQGA